MASLRVYKATAVAFVPPSQTLRAYKLQVTAEVPDLQTLRVYEVSTIAEIRRHFVRRSGQWVHVQMFARKGGLWM